MGALGGSGLPGGGAGGKSALGVIKRQRQSLLTAAAHLREAVKISTYRNLGTPCRGYSLRPCIELAPAGLRPQYMDSGNTPGRARVPVLRRFR